MSMVTVLTPHGRRQTVKVTPNTTLLQVLEEVCQKHGFEPGQFDLKHHRKVLDLSNAFRFTGLPNNAQLELVEALKPRLEAMVTVCLHLESGERPTGDFAPSDSLWKVIETLNAVSNVDANPVIIYMRKEICGEEALRKTTLRELGLTQGRAMVRFLHRSPEELKSQAHVSAPLVRPTKPDPPPVQPSPHDTEKVKEETAKEDNKNKSNHMEVDENTSTKISDSSTSCEKMEEDNLNLETKDNDTSSDQNSRRVTQSALEPREVQESAEVQVQKAPNTTPTPPKAVFLGARNALAFDLSQSEPLEFDDLPDDFYELTVDDAKVLLKDAKQFYEDLENAPLQTAQQREFEENKRMLNVMHHYKTTVLRVRFPDSTVLQGTFSATELVTAVHGFVASYLDDPTTAFYLYTTPPKTVLNSDSRLIEANLVPNAVLYYGVETLDGSYPTSYLHQDVLSKMSTFTAANAAVHFSEKRGGKKSAESGWPTDERKSSTIEPVPGTSRDLANSYSKPGTSKQKAAATSGNVPKWFKSSTNK